MSKQDRQGVRTAADLERKYQFGKQFSEIMGLANDARDAANEIESTLNSAEFETKIQRTARDITSTALAAYTTTEGLDGKLSSLQQTVLKQTSDNISVSVKAVEDEIKRVDGDLQKKYNEITKYFTFDINGLTIGQVDNPNKVVIDNDNITIYVKENPVIEFKADGTASIPSLSVESSFEVVGLQITEDETHISCGLVG